MRWPFVLPGLLAATAFAPLTSSPSNALPKAPIAATAAAPIVPRHDRDDAAYRELAARYPAVGRLAHGGSGTLIAPRFVLTAAHCVLFADAVTFEIAGRQVPVQRWFWYPPAFPGDRQIDAGEDIALLELAEPVTDVAPLPLAGHAPDREPELGREALLVGFGMSGDGQRGAIEPHGTKRAAWNVIDAIGGTVGAVEWTRKVLLFDFDGPAPEPSAAPLATAPANWLGTATPLELEGGLATGDSGGALLLDDSDDGSGAELVGVLSGVSGAKLHVKSGGPDNRYGVYNRAMRVAAFRDWIDHAMAAATAERDGAPLTRPSLTWRSEATAGGTRIVIVRDGDPRWPLALRWQRRGELALRGLLADPATTYDAELIDPSSGMALLDGALLPAGATELVLLLRPLDSLPAQDAAPGAAPRSLELTLLPAPFFTAPPHALALRLGR